MCRVKTIDWPKIWIYIIIFVAIIGVTVGTANNSKYDVIRFGDAHFRLPNRITGSLDRIDGENYVFLHSDDYLVLGVGPDCEGIDSDILEQFDISFEKLKEVNSIKYEYELTELVGDSDGVVVDSGKTDKPSFDKYYIRYKSDNVEKIILVFTANNKSVIEIIVAPKDDISKKEFTEMLGTIRYRYR